jgi:uncharacterized protein (DUF1697 family)
MGLFRSNREVLEKIRALHLEVLRNQNLIVRLTMTAAELTAKLDAFTAQVIKVHDEEMAKLEELQAIIRDNPVPPAVEQAVDRLAAAIQTTDDVIPDAPAGGA